MANILIVDDDLGMLRVLGLIIEQEEHTAFEAGGGVKALKVLEAHHIDLAFIDLMMPAMDGIELMKRVRELYPNVKLARTSLAAKSVFLRFSRTPFSKFTWTIPRSFNSIRLLMFPCVSGSFK